ncbi:TetR/AcrR family transcriptional regulator [Curtobacterium sp. MCPF17_047]|uniref:TetR/AcrR family transcriptional regulator n=1 Tax=unclassified Curtobacterium TaxID=257496 RepID=UPI000DA7F02A|nr:MULTISPECIES: TetR/AcrR family transcriptional regulator [unclassified Curtobacterium]PZE63028.1 TetR/AcrR family transcriptional regulator [Curtobacterium sp. MCPF17_001]PZF68959.1 TetR/AcrR family transcriptional regulator [Curtobacterium sp. MCPF17_047]WIB11331.1 TetR/AcrR family transcriptional regulator [Curtobacterium sp. MCPF17_052]
MPTDTDSRQAILDAGRRTTAHKGWAAVGLNEILAEAGVPRGSFYYYFKSKDVFGEVMMRDYFRDHLVMMDDLLAQQDRSVADRLMQYFRGWRELQSLDDCQGRCLAVKLGAEVADLSESMRLVFMEGTTSITERIAKMIPLGLADGSLAGADDPAATAEMLYDLWLGASVMAKIHRNMGPLDRALTLTAQLLHA